MDSHLAEAAEAVVGHLRRLGVIAPGEAVRDCDPLAGGVSSEIWRIDTDRRSVCVKRALPRLKVSAEWFAPVERNAFEAGWFEVAGRIVPDAVPRILAHDAAAGLLVMDHLDPRHFRLWKEELRQGRVDLAVCEAVGRRLVRIHAWTASDGALSHRFATGHLFHALRLEPYFIAAANAHPDRAAALQDLVEVTAGTRLALVHGDVSPKNILIGPRGPVFLDAECAWYGDPAFDLAFCLNHLLLKYLWVGEAAAALVAGYCQLAEAYLQGVAWEPAEDLEARAARLLPGLLLARVDGKSPVEYLVDDGDKERVRRVARVLLAAPVVSLGDVLSAWVQGLPE